MKNIFIFQDSEDEADELSQRERDARTIIAMQIAHDLTERDLKDFFSAVGDVRKCKIIKDDRHKTQGFYTYSFLNIFFFYSFLFIRLKVIS